MAKVKISATKQRVAILHKEGYISRAVSYSKIAGEEVIEFAAMNSGINEGQLAAAIRAIVQEFRNHLLTGHAVELPGVGIFRVGVGSKMVDTADEVSVDNIRRRTILYRPSVKLKKLLGTVSFTTTGDDGDDEVPATEGGSGNSSQGSSSNDDSGNSSTGGNTSDSGGITEDRP